MEMDHRAALASLRPRVRRFAATLARTDDAADDLTQTAFAKALARLDQFTPGTRLDRWMFRIVHTTWIDETRARRRRPEPDPDAVDLASDDGEASRGSEARVDLARVRRALERLSDDHRAVIGLVVFEDCTYREAAEALDVPVGTVMSRLARAREQLAALLDVERRANL